MRTWTRTSSYTTIAEYRQMAMEFAKLYAAEERARKRKPQRSEDFDSGFIPSPPDDGDYG